MIRYMQGFKCKVTNASPTALPLAAAQVPTYCADDQSKCVKGAKQMLAWHQKEGNNIETTDGKTPNYNTKCGWAEGAQTDIFSTSVQNATSTESMVASESAVQTLSTMVVVKDGLAVSTLTPQSALSTGGPAARTHIGTPWKFRHGRRPRPTAVPQV